jgi:hypothetical protein
MRSCAACKMMHCLSSWVKQSCNLLREAIYYAASGTQNDGFACAVGMLIQQPVDPSSETLNAMGSLSGARGNMHWRTNSTSAASAHTIY